LRGGGKTRRLRRGQRDLLAEESTELSMKVIDVMSVDASEAEFLEDGKEVSNGANGQEWEGVGSFSEVGAARGAEK
jgi:hypothetical protein